MVNTSEGQYHCCGDLIFTYDNLKPVPEMHYDITPPGRFLDIVDEWNSIVEPVSYTHLIPKEQALVIFRQILLALLLYLHGFPLSSKYS